MNCLGQLTLPLSVWAQKRLDSLACLSSVDPRHTADALMRERALINGYLVPGKTSAGGGSRFYRTRDGFVALNLAREDDRMLLPALFGRDHVHDLAPCFAQSSESELVARGHMLGLAIAGLHEQSVSPVLSEQARGKTGAPCHKPRVLDLSALWAGPLASRLLQEAGCDVTRVDSVGRPDLMERFDPAHFKALNAGKLRRKLDLRCSDGRREFVDLVRQSDIVIEAARPRALLQLGIDADAIVRSQPGLTWLTITGHGAEDGAADWVAFGDDASVTGGLSREMAEATGTIAFVGDAIADPLSGICAAEAGYRHHLAGGGVRLILSMSGLVSEAIRGEKELSETGWHADLVAWSAQTGKPFARQPVTRELVPSC